MTDALSYVDVSLGKNNIKKFWVSSLIDEWKLFAFLIIEFRLYLSWKIFFANENFGILLTKIQFILGENLASIAQIHYH